MRSMNRGNTSSAAQPRVNAGPHPSGQDGGAAMSLYAHFERAAATWPDRPALRIHPSNAPWRCYTYRQLLDAAAQLDTALTRFGLEPGDRVVLCAESGPEWGIAYVALQRAGLVAVPLDPQLSAPQVAQAARFSGARVLLVGRQTRADAAEMASVVPEATVLPLAPPLVPLPGTAGEVQDVPPPRPASGDRPASLLFTSGTLREPRAVALSHTNFIANVRDILDWACLAEEEQFLSVLPLYHAFEFTVGFLAPLGSGACITYADEIKGSRIAELMRETGTTRMVCVPRLLHLLAQGIRQKVHDRGLLARFAFSGLLRLSGWNGRRLACRFFPAVHRVFGGRFRSFYCGGSTLDPDLARFLFDLGLPVYEGYGLTETGPVLTMNRPGHFRLGAVGKALPHVELFVHNPNADGVGEVCARGPNVFTGYYRDPEATAAAFLDGWFRTGDLGRLDREGYLQLGGRIKDVIIPSSGQNVCPDELERSFAALPRVRELCVLGVSPPGRGEEIHLVAVPEEGSGHDGAEADKAICQAVARVAATLPSHQRPHRVHIRREVLPRTSTLKLKRRLLRDELLGRLQESATPPKVATRPAAPGLPRTDDSTALAAVRSILVTVLGDSERAARVGATDHLQFDVGLDSIGLHQLVVEMENVSGRTISADQSRQWIRVSDLLPCLENLNGVGHSACRGSWLPHIQQASRQGRASALLGPARWAVQSTLGWLTRIYLSIQVRGLENVPRAGTFLVVANHCSHLDSLVVRHVLGGLCRVRVGGAADYFFRGPISRFVCTHLLDIIPISREGQPFHGLGRCLEHLRAKPARPEAVLLFPEGTRSPTGSLQPFKVGVGLLAVESGAPVVPAWIDGTHALMPRGKRWPRSGEVRICLGRPTRAAEAPFAGTPGSHAHFQDVARHIRKQVEELSCCS
jgi:long-chain acyl-CoA synthetase